jgi:outer membrane protein TolC
MQQLQLQKRLANLQQQTEKSKYLPTVRLKGFTGANQYSNLLNPVASNTWFGYSYLKLDAKLPLLNGEDKQKKIRELQLQSNQYQKKWEDKSAQHQQQITTALLQLRNLESQLQNQEANLALERQSVRLIKTG